MNFSGKFVSSQTIWKYTVYSCFNRWSFSVEHDYYFEDYLTFNWKIARREKERWKCWSIDVFVSNGKLSSFSEYFNHLAINTLTSQFTIYSCLTLLKMNNNRSVKCKLKHDANRQVSRKFISIYVGSQRTARNTLFLIGSEYDCAIFFHNK